jgi:hypothetical protein
MPQHVRMGLELQAGSGCGSLDHPGEAGRDANRRLGQPPWLTHRPSVSRSFRNGGEGMHDQRGA